MPCRSDAFDNNSRDYRDTQRIIDRNNDLTKMLCEACRYIERVNRWNEYQLSENLIKWWIEN